MQTDRNVVVPLQPRADDREREPERFVDSSVAAKFLSVSKKWILLLAQQGEIPAYPLGLGQQRRIWRFRLSELAEAMEERMTYRKGMETVTESRVDGGRSRRS
jgi:excisionase family DNA binding protein